MLGGWSHKRFALSLIALRLLRQSELSLLQPLLQLTDMFIGLLNPLVGLKDELTVGLFPRRVKLRGDNGRRRVSLRHLPNRFLGHIRLRGFLRRRCRHAFRRGQLISRLRVEYGGAPQCAADHQ